MGNYVSCALSVPGSKHSRVAKVIFPSGEIRQIQTPFKAAELMLETPNLFLVNMRSLHIGRMFSALNADEDLEMANVYVMFPMKRLNSVVTAGNAGALLLAANAAAKRTSGGKVRILPESEMFEWEAQDLWKENEGVASPPKLNLDDIEEFSSPEYIKHRVSIWRSKKPLLETIAEETVCTR